ncbi:MoeB [Porphyromonas crevioricanis]|uniref:MoeB n=2 Tax=Porphyromonas crevioricanis TaxID=393921 RepID=A0A0A2FJR0_9PORP|nr:tRNA threonylcarbamoyladenosine dehydratase [Porphyromonas crevioricanis]KGN91321.1 MoeB [Porphyromonas crevioricanis]KGN94341.1 MoeB [Porphyromonas crevioricanis]SJZ98694.1 tRNA A37 threonylcarbamoyladenosine dehydratase [Porphyromonas crevioricanis]SQH72941.1 Sulfur carrier protein ThiS adenylyltransferase [Porphyromonas crevioricanis]GAD04814.1 HesA/MoeB/ThiF family protein [Porphyromonas crevioricanis JCM 15906]
MSSATIPEWQSRTALLLGEKGQRALSAAHVLVVGLGGVGGWAAEMLARAGVGRMTIVDADEVSPSNINRQLVATHSSIGRPKTEVLAERLRDINPDIELYVHHMFVKDEAMESLLDEAPYDYVLDAIDSLSPKVYLIALSLQRGLRIISSMGAGAKLDPSCIQVDDISHSHNCTLARSVRKRLRPLGIRKGVPVVYSTELPDSNAVISVSDECCKRSTAGTLSYMPALFGIRMAAEVIRTLSGC